MKRLLLALVLGGCGASHEHAPGGESVPTDGGATGADAPPARDVPTDGPAPVPPGTCTAGVLTLVREGTLELLSLDRTPSGWAVTYQHPDGRVAWLVVVSGDGAMVGDRIPLPRGARVARFGDALLVVPEDVSGELALHDATGAFLRSFPFADDGEMTAAVVAADEGDVPRVLIATLDRDRRFVYEVLPEHAERTMVLPRVAGARLGLSPTSVIDVSIDEPWDGDPSLRIWARGRTPESPVLVVDVPVWEDGPQSIAAITRVGDDWSILGARRDPETRFYRGRAWRWCADTSECDRGAPFRVEGWDRTSPDPRVGAYYGVTGDESWTAASVFRTIASGVGSRDGWIEHHVGASARISAHPGLGRVALAGVDPAGLHLRCDLGLDGSHGGF